MNREKTEYFIAVITSLALGFYLMYFGVKAVNKNAELAPNPGVSEIGLPQEKRVVQIGSKYHKFDHVVVYADCVCVPEKTQVFRLSDAD